MSNQSSLAKPFIDRVVRAKGDVDLIDRGNFQRYRAIDADGGMKIRIWDSSNNCVGDVSPAAATEWLDHRLEKGYSTTNDFKFE